jgi:hypothetical protein
VGERERAHGGILSGLPDLEPAQPRRVTYPAVQAKPGLIIEHRPSGQVGFIVRADHASVVLRDKTGRDHALRYLPGAFVVDGTAVTLIPPDRTARLLIAGVEGAQLIEGMWGDELRAEGVSVQHFDPWQSVTDAIETWRPGPGRRLGVLTGARDPLDITMTHVLVIAIPFPEIWLAVKPKVLGMTGWPNDPAATPEPVRQRLVGSVRGYGDLDPALVGAVEALVDFMTAG